MSKHVIGIVLGLAGALIGVRELSGRTMEHERQRTHFLTRFLPRRDCPTAGEHTPAEILSLLNDTESIAAKYAHRLNQPTLHEPLGAFLEKINAVQGIDALALAIWDAPQMPSSLTVCALMDTIDTHVDRFSESISPVREAHDALDTAVRRQAPPWSSSLFFLPSPGDDLSDLIPQLKQKLDRGLMRQTSGHGERLSFITLARPALAIAEHR